MGDFLKYIVIIAGKQGYIQEKGQNKHGGLSKDIKEEPADGLTIKEEPANGSTIKEEPIDCNDCGTCDACETIHGVVMSVDCWIKLWINRE